MMRAKLTEEQATALLGELSPDSTLYKIVIEFAGLTPQLQKQVLDQLAEIRRRRSA